MHDGKMYELHGFIRNQEEAHYDLPRTFLIINKPKHILKFDFGYIISKTIYNTDQVYPIIKSLN